MLDFTTAAYKKLIAALRADGYTICTVLEYIKKAESFSKVIILRHDVDNRPENSLLFAEIESSLGIISSYYFRYPHTFRPGIIRKICNLGHEIGYHYETLAKTRGSYIRALELFNIELNKFRSIVAVETISAHGSPLSRWDNRKLWKQYDFTSFGIAADAYLSIDFTNVFYLSDTGRGWNSIIGNLRDKVSYGSNLRFRNTFEIISAAQNSQLPKVVMMNIHPQRWSDNIFAWSIELFGQNLKNILKGGILLYGRVVSSRTS